MTDGVWLVDLTAIARGRVYGFASRLDDARRPFARAIDDHEQLGDHRLALVARSDLAHASRINVAVTKHRRSIAKRCMRGAHRQSRNQLESVALMAIAANDDLRAARLLAAAEAIREAVSAPMLVHERADHDGAVATLRERVDAASLTQAWADGRELTSDQAVGLALAVL